MKFNISLEIMLFGYGIRIVNKKLWNMDGQWLLRHDKTKESEK